ncbi:Ja185 [Japanese cytomegalovirus]|nr:Ja185 [Japanese cytomegalovirus]
MKPLCGPCGSSDPVVIGSLLCLLVLSGVTSAWRNDSNMLQKRDSNMEDTCSRESERDNGLRQKEANRHCPFVDQGPACDAFMRRYEPAVRLLGCDPELRFHHGHALNIRGLFGCPKATPKGIVFLLERYGGATLVLYLVIILLALMFTALMLYIIEDLECVHHLRRCGSH